MLDAALRARVVAWRDDDPDETTVAQTDALVTRAEAGDADAITALTSSFGAFLEFGTAGLRGEIGPGPSRMNRAVVSRAAAGLAAYLRANSGRRAVVGYDARHRSIDFAVDTCEILQAGRSRSVAVRRTSITRVPARGYAARRSARPNTADAPKWTFACRRYAHVMNVVRPLDDQRFVDSFCSMRVQTRMAPYTDAKGSQSWSVDVHFFGSQLSPLQ